MDIRYGGHLKKGDFIAIGYTYRLSLGFFIEESPSTLRFYDPSYVNWAVKNNKKIYKQYIYKNLAKHGRVIKITNPEEVLSGEDLEKFLEARENLEKLGIINKLELI